jgi:enolase
MPVGNCIGGGLHSKGLRGKSRIFKNFYLSLKKKDFSTAVTKNILAYNYAKRLLKKKNKKIIITRNDENALNTSTTNEETLEIFKAGS